MNVYIPVVSSYGRVMPTFVEEGRFCSHPRCQERRNDQAAD